MNSMDCAQTQQTQIHVGLPNVGYLFIYLSICAHPNISPDNFLGEEVGIIIREKSNYRFKTSVKNLKKMWPNVYIYIYMP